MNIYVSGWIDVIKIKYFVGILNMILNVCNLSSTFFYRIHAPELTLFLKRNTCGQPQLAPYI